MIYLDTSVVISALTAEPTTERVQDWLEQNIAQHLCISPWVVTEVHSALSLKIRSGRLTLNTRDAALHEFGLMRGQVTICDVEQAHFAAAADNGAALATLDKTQADATEACGLTALRPA
jgi:uncharacterized protein